jgi:signal transduction histidine kinase
VPPPPIPPPSTNGGWEPVEWHHRNRRHRSHVSDAQQWTDLGNHLGNHLGQRLRRQHGPHRHFKGPLRRDPDGRVLAGICGGLSNATGLDVTLIRIAFVIITLVSGWPALVYVIGWLFLPMTGETSNILSRVVSDKRGIRLVIATLPLMVMVQIVVSILHIGYIGFFGWPLCLAASLCVLIWRNTSEDEQAWVRQGIAPMLHVGDERISRTALIVRVAAGVALGAGGVLLLVLGKHNAAIVRPVGGVLLVIAAIVLVFGPWWLSLVRDLISERQARALAEERTQMAAHVHDSVLQTLALIQRSADDPQHVVRLARTQERELRAWLFEGRAPGSVSEDATMLGEGIGLLQRQVEADHGFTVQVVMVGDCPLTDGLRALLDAAKEATVNSAKWSGEPQASLYAEVEGDTVMVYVRDRGRGFDPEAVPDDRQGIAQSIRARLARCGGSVVIRSAPGEGTEVELSMPAHDMAK